MVELCRSPATTEREETGRVAGRNTVEREDTGKAYSDAPVERKADRGMVKELLRRPSRRLSRYGPVESERRGVTGEAMYCSGQESGLWRTRQKSCQ